MFSLSGPIATCYFRHCEIFFGTNVICWNSRICRAFCSYAVTVHFSSQKPRNL